jgi:hypothetical protein
MTDPAMLWLLSRMFRGAITSAHSRSGKWRQLRIGTRNSYWFLRGRSMNEGNLVCQLKKVLICAVRWNKNLLPVFSHNKGLLQGNWFIIWSFKEDASITDDTEHWNTWGNNHK